MTTAFDSLETVYGVPPFLLRELRRRNALPNWWYQPSGGTHSQEAGSDWVALYYSNLTGEFPKHVRQAIAGSIDRSLAALAHVSCDDNAVAIPRSLVPLLAELSDAMFGQALFPESSNPHASMVWSREGKHRSAEKLGAMIGRLRATGSPDCLSSRWTRSPAIIAAAHFVVCHEIVHIWNAHVSRSEGKYHQEYEADSLARLLLCTTYRNHPIYQELLSFSGPVLSLLLEAVKEIAFPIQPLDRTHPVAYDRILHLKGIAAIEEQGGGIAKGAVATGDEFWAVFSELSDYLDLHKELITNPVAELVERFANKTSTPSNSKEFVDVVLQWCAFGSVTHVGKSLAEAFHSKPTDSKSLLLANLLANIKLLEPYLQLAHLLSSIPTTKPLVGTNPRYDAFLNAVCQTSNGHSDDIIAEDELFRRYMRVLFGTLTLAFPRRETAGEIIAEKIVSDPDFVAVITDCNPLIDGLRDEARIIKLCKEAIDARVPRLAVFTVWSVEAFERLWVGETKEIDSLRFYRTSKLLFLLGLLLHDKLPSVVTLLMSEWSKRSG